MKSPATPLEIEMETLRRSAGRHEFAAAESSARRYAGLLDASLPALDAAEREIRLREGLQLLEWCRRTLRATHKRLSDELGRLQAHAGYRAPEAATPTWKLEG